VHETVCRSSWSWGWTRCQLPDSEQQLHSGARGCLLTVTALVIVFGDTLPRQLHDSMHLSADSLAQCQVKRAAASLRLSKQLVVATRQYVFSMYLWRAPAMAPVVDMLASAGLPVFAQARSRAAACRQQ
jgi:hypothetical protein